MTDYWKTFGSSVMLVPGNDGTSYSPFGIVTIKTDKGNQIKFLTDANDLKGLVNEMGGEE